MVRFRQVHKQYQGREILKDINALFSPKEHYVIFGESGSGKTTLLNLIAKYDEVNQGSIDIEQDVRIEYLFQDPLLFSNITVKENMFIKERAKNKPFLQKDFEENCKQVLEMFSVAQFFEEKVFQLSGGEKRRVELAQTFLSNPDILLLDEPTGNLDKENKEKIIQLIHKTFQNSAVILVSHEAEAYFEGYTLLRLKEGELFYARKTN